MVASKFELDIDCVVFMSNPWLILYYISKKKEGAS